MLESLGFTPHEQRIGPWIIALGILVMAVCFTLFDYSDRHPSRVQAFFDVEQNGGPAPALPETLRNLRYSSAR